MEPLRIYRISVIILPGILLLAALWLPPILQADDDLPTRPTPAATPIHHNKNSAPADPTSGAYIALPPTQGWTVVQWQDFGGGWHDVEGWQGSAETGQLWWVAPKDFQTGPFRWVVKGTTNGEIIATSPSFSLPAEANTTMVITISEME